MKTLFIITLFFLMFTGSGNMEKRPHARKRHATNNTTQVWKREEENTMKRNTYEMLTSIAATNSGATLENYLPIHYAAGYQYSMTENGSGNCTADIDTAAAMIDSLGGTCGVWYDNGLYYIETSYHAATIEQAMNAAKKAKQLSIYDWKNDAYIPVE